MLQAHTHDQEHSNEHDHQEVTSAWNTYLPAIISLVLLLTGLAMEHLWEVAFFTGVVKVIWYLFAYLPVAWPVLLSAWRSLWRGSVFNEFFLMSIATIGAFAIGEYPEGVAVMLFYAVGELFQESAVQRAKSNIQSLLDVRPKIATVFRNDSYVVVAPDQVAVGEIIQVKAGEKIPLDGQLRSEKAVLNTAALTGESKPTTVRQGEQVLAGSINLDAVIELEVEKLFQDSSIARILELVQHASSRKAKTELLIRRLAKIYTPIVVYLAIAICILPYFFVADYDFSDWLYRALIFLVISCPCALVISIPLGYFGGLGAASKNGLLFKGATYLDQLTKVRTLVLDKTGTVTQGIFAISEIVATGEQPASKWMPLLLALEAKSTHPIAKALGKHPLDGPVPDAEDVEEIAGKGLSGKVGGKHVLAGNQKLLTQFGIEVPESSRSIVESVVFVAVDQQLVGYVIISDQLKADAKLSIDKIQKAGIKRLVMLSGDQSSITQKVAKELGIKEAKGNLLPEDKLAEVEALKKDAVGLIAFVGDGINDAPVLAASDIGIAMGAMGSDVAIETADVIIQTDQLVKIATGIKIARSTQRIIWQNIALALGVKVIVLILGALGMATMWAAVFADVGVAMLAILNAVRLQWIDWE